MLSSEEFGERKNHEELRELFKNLGNDEDGALLYAEAHELRNRGNDFLKPFADTESDLRALVQRAWELEERISRHVPNGIDESPEFLWSLESSEPPV